MKSIFIKSIAFSLLAIFLWSCEKVETKTVATAGTAGTIKSNQTSVEIDRSVLESNVVTFDFAAADFGYPAAITNTLQIGVKGTNFATVKEFVLSVGAKQKVFKGLEFNNLLLALNLSTEHTTDVEIRLKSSLSASTSPVYSNTVTVNVLPFALTAFVYVPGNYQNWNPETAEQLVSPTGNGVFTGIIKMDGGDFKIAPTRTWTGAFGDAGSGTLSTSGGNINSVSAGYKLITVDLNALTYKIEPAKTWSIIGSVIPGSVDWNMDLDLTSLNDGKNTWVITTDLVAGAFKFRYGREWGKQVGNEVGGGDITISTSGNYTLTLTLNADGSAGTYTIVKN